MMDRCLWSRVTSNNWRPGWWRAEACRVWSRSNLISRQGGRVRDMVWQRGGPLLMPHGDHLACSNVWGYKCNVKGL